MFGVCGGGIGLCERKGVRFVFEQIIRFAFCFVRYRFRDVNASFTLLINCSAHSMSLLTRATFSLSFLLLKVAGVEEPQNLPNINRA